MRLKSEVTLRYNNLTTSSMDQYSCGQKVQHILSCFSVNKHISLLYQHITRVLPRCFTETHCDTIVLSYDMKEQRRLHLLTGLMRDVSEFEEEAVHIEVFLGGRWKRRVMVLPKWQIAIMQRQDVYHMTDDDQAEIQVRLASGRR